MSTRRYYMNSKTLAILFAMFSLGDMIAIPGLSLAQQQPAYAQNLDIPLLDDLRFVDGEEEEDESNSQTIEQSIDQAVSAIDDRH